MKDNNEEKTWHDARQYCISQGGNLVSILSQAEQGTCETRMQNIALKVYLFSINFDIRGENECFLSSLSISHHHDAQCT